MIDRILDDNFHLADLRSELDQLTEEDIQELAALIADSNDWPHSITGRAALILYLKASGVRPPKMWHGFEHRAPDNIKRRKARGDRRIIIRPAGTLDRHNPDFTPEGKRW